MCGDAEQYERLNTPIFFTADGIPVCHNCLGSHFDVNGYGYASRTTCKKCGEAYDEFHELNLKGKFVGIISLRNYP